MSLVKPYSDQAERAVLGAMMLDGEAVSYCSSTLSIDDFFVESHKVIFEAMMDIKEDRKPIDLTSISSKLDSIKKLEEVGGVSELSSLIDGVVDGNIQYYVEILKDKTNLRMLSDFLDKEYKDFGEKSQENIHTYLDYFEDEILKITRARSVSDFKSINEVVAEYQKLLNDKKIKMIGVTTGYQYLNDKLNGGWQKGNLIILAGRPGMGKTAVALNFALNAAKESKTPIAFFSLEMSKLELVQRMISIMGRIDNKKVINGDFHKNEDLVRLDGALNNLKGLPIYIDDTPSLKLVDFIAKVRKLKGENKDLGLIIVDYLQIIEVEIERGSSRERAVAKVATKLKQLARDTDIPILALAQLGRGSEKGGFVDKNKEKRKRPDLTDLRESGQIEADADLVLFIYKEAYYNDEKNDDNLPEEVEIIIKKNRHGETGTAFLMLTPNCFKYDAKVFGGENKE